MKKIVIATHSSVMIEGPAHNLRKYLTRTNQARDLWYMSHPLLTTKDSYALTSEVTVYRDGKKTGGYKAVHWNLPEPLLYVKDVCYTVRWSAQEARS